MDYKKDDVVTVDIPAVNSSNTYFIYRDLDDEKVLIYHPLFQQCLMERDKSELNKVSPQIKDSMERCLDYAKNNLKFLDYNTVADLEALCLYFVVKRQLTPKQKSILSHIVGTIASIKFNNDILLAMETIKKNSGVLDDFNTMWYNNFQGLFTGKQRITSKKQRASIFNMAGFVMAQLETPKISK